MSALDWLTARPVAHRGLHDAAAGIIENTASAFAAAIAGGFGIECDVRLSADGEAMVFHDSTLERLTEASGAVAERTAAELKAIAFKDTADRIQTLGDLLDQIDGQVTLIIEIKSAWTGDGQLEKRVAALAAGYRGPVAAMSFDPRTVLAVKQAAPRLARGIVSERFRDLAYWNRYGLTAWQRFYLRHMLHFRRTEPDFIAYDIAGLPSAAPLIGRLLLGKLLLTWTVRTADDRVRAARYADQAIFEGFLPDGT